MTLKVLATLALTFVGLTAEAQIRVDSATYGRNCGAWFGNATQDVAWNCDGRQTCDYFVSVSRLGDPAPGCTKSFEVEYSCGWGGARQLARLRPEAANQRIRLDCWGSDDRRGGLGIQVVSATYGSNVGAWRGNVTHAVAQECNGQRNCRYFITTDRIGDPFPGQTKDFVVEYTCQGSGLRRAYVAPEAHGRVVDLSCGRW